MQVLKQILPVDKARKKDEDKETKVKKLLQRYIMYRKLGTISDLGVIKHRMFDNVIAK